MSPTFLRLRTARLFAAAAAVAASMALGPGPVNGASGGTPLRILALGDSLTAGQGLPRGASFPAVLERELKARGLPAAVTDAGVSGDTSAGGRARLAWTLSEAFDLAIVELGANDGLRGLSPEALEENLRAIVEGLKRRGVAVLLAGMRAPPNLGEEYARSFDGVYRRVAEQTEVELYPFFLEGVAAVPGLLQPDGMHPNEKGVEEIVRRIAPVVAGILRRPRGRPQ